MQADLEKALNRINNGDLRDLVRKAMDEQGYTFGGSRGHGAWFYSADGSNTVSVPWTTSDHRSIVKTATQFRRWAVYQPKAEATNGNPYNTDEQRRMRIVEVLVGAGPLNGIQIAQRMGVEFNDKFRHALIRMADGNKILRWGSKPGDGPGRPMNIYAPLGYSNSAVTEMLEEVKEEVVPLIIHSQRAAGFNTRKDHVLHIVRNHFAGKQFSSADIDKYIGANSNPSISELTKDGKLVKSGRTGPSEGHSRGFQMWALVTEQESQDRTARALGIPTEAEWKAANPMPALEIPVNPSPIPLPDPEDHVHVEQEAPFYDQPKESKVLPNYLGMPPSFWEDVFMGIAAAFAGLQRD